jgi:hypothetical protein
MTTPALPLETTAELLALQALAVKHRREYMRLRTRELAKLTGEPVRFTRDRWTPEQLAALPDVLDSTGAVLQTGQRVRCPDGVRGVIERVDKRSRRCVVVRADNTKKMTVATRLTIVTGGKKNVHVSQVA